MSDTSYAVFQHYGTAAQRGAFTPSPAATGQPIYLWYETDTGSTYLYHTAWVLLAGAGTVTHGNNFRLTTESGVPVSTSDRTSQGTIYWTPYKGNRYSIYTGSFWITLSSSQLSLALTATSGSNYDVFVDYNAGTPQLILGTAWTNDTTRAVALTTQDGVYVLTGNTDHLYVGTIRASGSNVTEDSEAKRFVWNYYNQVSRVMRVIETTDSWTSNSTTYLQARGSTANQLDAVIGLTGSPVLEIEVMAFVAVDLTGRTGSVSIGYDSTTVSATGVLGHWSGDATLTGKGTSMTAKLKQAPLIGRHFWAWLERVNASTQTFYGDAGAPTFVQSGIHGTIWN